MSRAGSAVRRGTLIFFAPSPSEPGGAQRRAQLLAGALAERGWNVLIVGRTAAGRRFWRRRSGGVYVIEIPGFGRRRLGALCFLTSALAIGLSAGLRSEGYLALQLSSPATAAALCGLIRRRPYVVMSSTSGALSEAALLRGGPGATIRRSLLARAAALVGQTQQAASELGSIFPRTATAVVPNPLPAIQAPPLSGRPRAAFSGRLSEEKDLPLLLRAWETIVSVSPEARLTLVGAGTAHRSVEAELREEVARRERLRDTVRFTGWLEDPTPELLAADVFAFPSRSEGMSNSLLEACALGRVVVASDIAPNLAVLGDDYPLLFSAGDQAALTEALRAAFADDALRARCRSQLAERVRLFSPTLVAERLEALFLDANRSRDQ